MLAVPSPWSVKVKPAGRGPDSAMVVTFGEPDVLIGKLFPTPAMKEAVAGLLNLGACVLTWMVKVWVASGAIPLLAVKVTG